MLKMINFALLIMIIRFCLVISFAMGAYQVYDPELARKHYRATRNDSGYLTSFPILAEVVTGDAEMAIIPSAILLSPDVAPQPTPAKDHITEKSKVRSKPKLGIPGICGQSVITTPRRDISTNRPTSQNTTRITNTGPTQGVTKRTAIRTVGTTMRTVIVKNVKTNSTIVSSKTKAATKGTVRPVSKKNNFVCSLTNIVDKDETGAMEGNPEDDRSLRPPVEDWELRSDDWPRENTQSRQTNSKQEIINLPIASIGKATTRPEFKTASKKKTTLPITQKKSNLTSIPVGDTKKHLKVNDILIASTMKAETSAIKPDDKKKSFISYLNPLTYASGQGFVWNEGKTPETENSGSDEPRKENASAVPIVKNQNDDSAEKPQSESTEAPQVENTQPPDRDSSPAPSLPAAVGQIEEAESFAARRYPDRSSCAQDGNICICEVGEFLNRLKKAAAEDEDSLMSIECDSFMPINDRKERPGAEYKHTAQNPELQADTRDGPKELSMENMRDLIERQEEDENYFVFRDRDIAIPCSADNMPPGKYRYIWNKKQSKGEPTAVAGDHISVNMNDGSLQLSEAQFQDRGVYLCLAEGDKQQESKFVHYLYVVALPELILQRTSDYRLLKKYDSELIKGHEDLMQEIENMICDSQYDSNLCRIETYNHTKAETGDDLLTLYGSKGKIFDSLSLVSQLRLMGLEKTLRKQSDSCGPECHMTIMYKLLDILDKNWRTTIDAFSMLKEDPTIRTVHPQRVMEIRTIIACEAGFELFQMFCVPCGEGTYSVEGKTVCKKCPIGSYQDEMGASACKSMVTRVCILLSLASAITVLSLVCVIIICRKMKRRRKKKKRNRAYD